jgi:aspartyl protease family protein
MSIRGQKRVWGWLALALLGPALGAVEHLQVLGLFRDKAVLRIDGQRRVLGVGQTSPEGVTLISADSQAAVLEVDGRRTRYGLGADVSAHLSAPPERLVQVPRDQAGMYRTVGSINGLPVNFLIDTGASRVAMNATEARRLGIDFRVTGDPGAVETASGVERAWRVRLDRVTVGAIDLNGVEGMVLEGTRPREVLLGMSFLGRIEMRDQGNLLRLRQTP